jgi:hypothetical protein
MGVSLHYKGKIKSNDMIPSMVAEVQDICDTNGWSYQIFEDGMFRRLGKNEDLIDAYMADEEEESLKKPDLGLRGISFRPHEESESVSLLFDENGILKSVLMQLFPEVQGHLKQPWAFTKTQFAGAEAHIKIVNLLVYLKKKYFKSFTLKDDGGYFPDMDENALRERIGFIDNAMMTINDIFENADFKGNPDDVMGQIHDAISQSFKDINVKIMRLDMDDFSKMKNEEKNEENENDKISEKKPKKRRKKDDNDEKENEI